LHRTVPTEVSMLSGVRGNSEELLKACCYAHLKKLGGEKRVGDQCDCPFFVKILLVNAEGCKKSQVL
jgi:hypothetical protein